MAIDIRNATRRLRGRLRTGSPDDATASDSATPPTQSAATMTAQQLLDMAVVTRPGPIEVVDPPEEVVNPDDPEWLAKMARARKVIGDHIERERRRRNVWWRQFRANELCDMQTHDLLQALKDEGLI